MTNISNVPSLSTLCFRSIYNEIVDATGYEFIVKKCCEMFEENNLSHCNSLCCSAPGLLDMITRIDPGLLEDLPKIQKSLNEYAIYRDASQEQREFLELSCIDIKFRIGLKELSQFPELVNRLIEFDGTTHFIELALRELSHIQLEPTDRMDPLVSGEHLSYVLSAQNLLAEINSHIDQSEHLNCLPTNFKRFIATQCLVLCFFHGMSIYHIEQPYFHSPSSFPFDVAPTSKREAAAQSLFSLYKSDYRMKIVMYIWDVSIKRNFLLQRLLSAKNAMNLIETGLKNITNYSAFPDDFKRFLKIICFVGQSSSAFPKEVDTLNASRVYEYCLKLDKARLGDSVEMSWKKLKIAPVPPDGTQLLDLRGNQIEVIPENVPNLNQLVALDLSFNGISEFPMGLFSLTNLKELDLSWNRIELIPSEIGSLSRLTHLYLDENPIKFISEDLCQLTELKELSFNNSLGNLFFPSTSVMAFLQQKGRKKLKNEPFGLQLQIDLTVEPKEPLAQFFKAILNGDEEEIISCFNQLDPYFARQIREGLTAYLQRPQRLPVACSSRDVKDWSLAICEDFETLRLFSPFGIEIQGDLRVCFANLLNSLIQEELSDLPEAIQARVCQETHILHFVDELARVSKKGSHRCLPEARKPKFPSGFECLGNDVIVQLDEIYQRNAYIERLKELKKIMIKGNQCTSAQLRELILQFPEDIKESVISFLNENELALSSKFLAFFFRQKSPWLLSILSEKISSYQAQLTYDKLVIFRNLLKMDSALVTKELLNQVVVDLNFSEVLDERQALIRKYSKMDRALERKIQRKTEGKEDVSSLRRQKRANLKRLTRLNSAKEDPRLLLKRIGKKKIGLIDRLISARAKKLPVNEEQSMAASSS